MARQQALLARGVSAVRGELARGRAGAGAAIGIAMGRLTGQPSLVVAFGLAVLLVVVTLAMWS